jgi:crossover junction endodeoxyribonuclease RuvC
MTLRVLGIDPGLTRCGYGVIDVEPNRRATLVTVGVFRTEPETALEHRLRALGRAVAAVLDDFRPDAVALERVFAQRNVRTVMGVAQVSGIVLAGAAERGLPIELHTPSEVKAAVTGYGNADKAQVGLMVARILRLDGVPKPADAADALALALCHGWKGTASPRATGRPTPAQQAWRAAERSSGMS